MALAPAIAKDVGRLMLSSHVNNWRKRFYTWRQRRPLKRLVAAVAFVAVWPVCWQIDLWEAKPALTVLSRTDMHLSREARGLISEDAQLQIRRSDSTSQIVN
jgi:hypothetical protein